MVDREIHSANLEFMAYAIVKLSKYATRGSNRSHSCLADGNSQYRNYAWL